MRTNYMVVGRKVTVMKLKYIDRIRSGLSKIIDSCDNMNLTNDNMYDK